MYDAGMPVTDPRAVVVECPVHLHSVRGSLRGL